MKKILLIASAVVLVTTCAVVACNQGDVPLARTEGLQAMSDHNNLVKRGAYLVNIMGCHDCHSPKVMGPHGPELDQERLLSGHPSNLPIANVNKGELKDWVLLNHMGTAAVGPWGVSFAANLTSDATGIGKWTEEQFFTAIRKGKYKGLENSRPLLPPMPWPVYANASDEDLRAIFYYLKATKPVSNVVPAPIAPDKL